MVALLAACSSPVGGASSDPKDDVLANVADPLNAARAARSLGDDAIVALLREATEPRVRVRAVRLAPWLGEPERALVPLAHMAAGSDPHLAPLAARQALVIGRSLTATALVSREADASELLRAATAFETLANDDGARADLRRAASLVVAALEALRSPSE